MAPKQRNWKRLYQPSSGAIVDAIEGLAARQLGYARYLKDAKTCSERVIYWSGKATFSVFQRYGKVLLFWTGKFEPSQDSVWLKQDVLFRCTNDAAASELIALLANKELPRGSKRLSFLWYDEKQGVLLRSFRGPSKRLANGTWREAALRGGVYRNHHVWGFTDATITKTYATEEKAIAAFEKAELAFLKAGGFPQPAAPFALVKRPRR